MANRKDEAAGGHDSGGRPQGNEKADERKSRGEQPQNPLEAAAAEAEDAIRQTAETNRRLADHGISRVGDLARRQEEQGQTLLTASTQAYRELTDFSRADLDALLQSSARLAQGLQEVSWEISNLTQQSVRLGMQLASNLMECRTVEDMVGVQRDFVKETVDTLLAESARIFSMSSRVASDAVTPLGERASQIAAETQKPAFGGRPIAGGGGQDMRH
ncbi:MAG TPA: phasin family protein [Rhodospirillaceae bacterium]|nr:phasin family protein [Rhodospirillaceae bacterium]